MDTDDPRQPLLGRTRQSRFRRTAIRLCNLESWKRRLPVTIWLPKYRLENLFRDLIAGITVGLTSIPQGIAYAMVAGVPPQVGLYSSAFPGMVYAIFGSCKDVTVGPTAILAALLAKYVAKSVDFAYLASLLTGCVIMLLGILQLGFLLDFISKPVISGFTTAAALQISASQLKSLFRISGSSGDTCIQALINFFKNIKTVHLWDTLLGVATIASLFVIKCIPFKATPMDSKCRKIAVNVWVYVVRARNALVVFVGSILAFVLYLHKMTPFALTGTIHSGLPDFGPPPFSTVVNNQTLNFGQMLEVFGPEGFVMPLVAILETIAIAKAFACGSGVDATQEMVAVGAANILASFAQAVPATGSFTRTALNHACGVTTPAGSFFKACLVLLAVTLLAEAFYFIPRATLAGVIMVAMMSIIELSIVRKLWRNSKSELCVWALTVCAGVALGLELGIAAGAAADVARLLAAAARPTHHAALFKVGHQQCACVVLAGSLRYAAGSRVARRVREAGAGRLLVLDAAALHHLDIGVAENLTSVIAELEKQNRKFLLWNFKAEHQRLLEDLHPGISKHFVTGPSIDQFVLGMNDSSEEIAA